MEIYNELHSLVKEINKKQNRDESHGVEHAKEVTDNSIKIYKKMTDEIDENILKLIISVAWLHDVNDHKYDYDEDSDDRIKKFLEQYYDNETITLIFNIIDRISYSKENYIIKNKLKYDWDVV